MHYTLYTRHIVYTYIFGFLVITILCYIMFTVLELLV